MKVSLHENFQIYGMLQRERWSRVRGKDSIVCLLYTYSCTSIVARKTGRIVLGTPSESRRRISGNESVLEGRAASTPQGNELLKLWHYQ